MRWWVSEPYGSVAHEGQHHPQEVKSYRLGHSMWTVIDPRLPDEAKQ